MSFISRALLIFPANKTGTLGSDNIFSLDNLFSSTIEGHTTPIFERFRDSFKNMPSVKVFNLDPIRQWLVSLNIEKPQRAHLICRVIPPQCPFERDINFLGKQIHIPPLCHLNPFYEEFTMLRFRALGYLADVCGEDVTKYCHSR